MTQPTATDARQTMRAAADRGSRTALQAAGDMRQLADAAAASGSPTIAQVAQEAAARLNAVSDTAAALRDGLRYQPRARIDYGSRRPA